MMHMHCFFTKVEKVFASLHRVADNRNSRQLTFRQTAFSETLFVLCSNVSTARSACYTGQNHC